MHNKDYYDNRRKDLETDFNESKEKTFAKFIQLADEWRMDAMKLQQKNTDLNVKEQQAIKQDKELEEAKAKEQAEAPKEEKKTK